MQGEVSSSSKIKVAPRGDGPFQVLVRINDNAYKLDLLGEYNVSATFNIFYLSLFNVGDDSRTNPFEEGGNDEIQGHKLANDEIQDHRLASKDPLHIRGGPITRLLAKRMQEALSGLIEDVWAKTFASSTMGEQQHLVHFMHIQP